MQSLLNSIELSGVNLVGHLLVMIFVIQWIAYIPAFIFKTEKFYDLTGSLTYISAILFALYSTNSSQDLNLGSLIIGAAIIIWAARLGSFLFMRVRKDKKDGRFDSIKTSFSQFFMTWTLQGMWVFYMLICCFGCNRQSNKRRNRHCIYNRAGTIYF